MTIFNRTTAAFIIIFVLLINALAQLLVVLGVIPSSIDLTQVSAEKLVFAETVAFSFVFLISFIAVLRANLLPIKIALPTIFYRLFFIGLALLFLVVGIANIGSTRIYDYLILAPVLFAATAASVRMAF